MNAFQQTEIHEVPTIGEVEAVVQYTKMSASVQKSVVSVIRADGRAMTPDESAFAAEFVYTAPNRSRL